MRRETGALPLLVVGAVTVLKDIGIAVAGFLVLDWFVGSGMSDEEAAEKLPEGWIGALERQLAADRYDFVYKLWADDLNAAGRASLKVTVGLAKKAVLERSVTIFEAYALEKALTAQAQKLAARAANNPDPQPNVTLLPSIELQGKPMVLSVGDETAPSLATSAWALPLLAVLALGLGAFFILGRS